MSTYTWDGNNLKLSEHYLYGSRRLGSLQVDKTIDELKTNGYGTLLGSRRYELTNHLGNVQAVISDNRNPQSSGTFTYYIPDIKESSDYYPFGMLMPGRNYNASAYKFGFNGKENDNEVMGITGALQDYGMRHYNSLIARFVSVDPITKDYPELTPFQFASNSPIFMIDIDGLEGRPTNQTTYYLYPELYELPREREVTYTYEPITNRKIEIQYRENTSNASKFGITMLELKDVVLEYQEKTSFLFGYNRVKTQRLIFKTKNAEVKYLLAQNKWQNDYNTLLDKKLDPYRKNKKSIIENVSEKKSINEEFDMDIKSYNLLEARLGLEVINEIGKSPYQQIVESLQNSSETNVESKTVFLPIIKEAK